ncbi:MAG: hypothetical protein Kow0056_03630 [Coriobacteriia bacterium]
MSSAVYQTGGHIAAYGLTDWYLSTFSNSERCYMELKYMWMTGYLALASGPPMMVFEFGEPLPAGRFLAEYLGVRLGKPSEFHLWYRVAQMAEACAAQEGAVSQFYVYDALIDRWYRERDRIENAYAWALYYCRKQVEIGESAAHALLELAARRQPIISAQQQAVMGAGTAGHPSRGRQETLKGGSYTGRPTLGVEAGHDRSGGSTVLLHTIRPPLPEHRGYQQLASLAEWDGDYDTAVRLSSEALRQGWKGDWILRLARAWKNASPAAAHSADLVLADLCEALEPVELEVEGVPGFYRGAHHTEWVDTVQALSAAGRLDVSARLLWCLIVAAEAEARVQGSVPPPWYFEQLGSVYRSQRHFADEVRLLERYAQWAASRGLTNPLQSRLDKARILLAQERGS